MGLDFSSLFFFDLKGMSREKGREILTWTYFLSIDQSYCLSNCLMVLLFLLFLFWDFDLVVLVC